MFIIIEIYRTPSRQETLSPGHFVVVFVAKELSKKLGSFQNLCLGIQNLNVHFHTSFTLNF